LNSSLISVIIPCYNYANYIGDCLDSVLAQTYTNWECIVVDDGSTDNSVAVIKQYCDNDSRIKCFTQINSGPTIARNFGLKNSQGTYIQFLDADDKIESKKFEIQLQLFETFTKIDIVYSDAKFFTTSSPEILSEHIDLKSASELKSISGNGDTMIRELIKGNIMVISSPLIKKKVFDDFGLMDEDLLYNEDWELWTRFALKNCSFLFDSNMETRALVRVHDSYSKDNFKMYLYGLLACQKIEKKIKDKLYNKIMIPKIAYHKRIIDENLLKVLKTSKQTAIDKVQMVIDKINSKRYPLYLNIFKYLPYGICLFISRTIQVFTKIKNTIVYA
jgi:glycosyltransferase involved in cell wall biosynthesis